MKRSSPLLSLLALLCALLIGAACSSEDAGPAGIDLPIDDSAQPEIFAGIEARFTVDLAELGELSAEPLLVWTFGDGASTQRLEPNVTHAWSDPGTYVLRVDATTAEGERLASGSLEVEVREPADLEALTPGLTQSAVRDRDPFSASVTVLNNGAAFETPFRIGAYALPPGTGAERPRSVEALDEMVDAGDALLLGHTEVGGLAADAQQEAIALEGLRFPEDTASGRYRLLVFVDPDRRIGETTEDNNAAIATTQITFTGAAGGTSRLTVQDVVARPERTNQLNGVTLSAVVANGGSQPALFVDYQILLTRGTGTPGEDSISLGSGRFDNIPAGRSATLTDVRYDLESAITETGEYFVTVVIPAAEGREAVQGVSNPIVITEEPVAGVDIVPTRLVVDPEVTFVGASIQSVVDVTNQGTEDAPRTFQCRIYLSPTPALDPARTEFVIDTFQVRSLPAGETSTFERVSPISALFSEGTYTPWVFCNPNQVIDESDFGNNQLRGEQQVAVAAEGEVDLAIADFTVSADTLADGETLEAEVEICNLGSSGATPNRVRVYLSRDNTFSRNDSILLDEPLPGIGPGACRTVTLSGPVTCDTFVSSYRLFVEADPTDLLEDTNRANNTRDLGRTFRITGPACECEPDPFEPNDSLASAAPLPPEAARYTDLSMCSANTDWYRIPLLQGESLRAVIEFDRDRGNLDLALLSTDGTTVLDSSATNRNREEVSFFVVPRDGDYYLRVQGRSASDRNLYDLEVSPSSPVPGTDLTVFGVELARDRVVPGDRVDLRFDVVNLGDTPAGSFLVRIWLAEDDRLDVARDRVVDEVSVSSLGDRRSFTREIQIPIDEDGGERFLIVEADARGEVEELDETNNIGVSDALFVDAGCTDPLEPNNSIGAARRLDLDGDSPFLFEGLRACTGNPDFYEICVSAGDTFGARIDFDQSEGDLDMRLFNASGFVIGRSESTRDFEEVGVGFVTSDTCYAVEVYTIGPDRNVRYGLTVTAEPAPAELQCNTAAEPNNQRTQAAPLRNWLNTDLALCPEGDVDWFRVDLPAAREVFFELLPADGDTSLPTQLRHSVWDNVGNFLTTATTAGERLRFMPPVTGPYFLRIQSASSGIRNLPYRIRVDGLSGVDLTPTSFTASPTRLSPGEQTTFNARILNAGEDPAPTFDVAVYLAPVPFLDERATRLRTFQRPALGPLEERTFSDKVTLPASTSISGNAWLLLVVNDSGDVEEIDPSNNDIVQPIEVLSACVPDAAEPNNVFLDAADGLAFDGEDLTLCTGETDWFYVDLNAGDALQATITFEHAAGDLDLYAFGPNLQEVARSTSTTDDEVVEFTASVSGRHYLQVVSFAPTVNTSYRLFVDDSE